MDTPWIADVASTASSVLLAMTPLLVLFLVFQIFVLNLPLRQVRDVLTGTGLAAVGLFLFLLGVNVGFLPFGAAIGEALGLATNPLLLAGIGVLLGFTTTWGEPAVRILADQIDEASLGSIPAPLVLRTSAAGVATWVAIGLLRIEYGIPLLWLIVPGYLAAIAMVVISEKNYISIAIDAGGVATGPLANTFLLALALGAAAANGSRDPLEDGLGFIALVALAPILSVMTLGVIIRVIARAKE